MTHLDERRAWWRRRFWDLLIVLLVLFIVDTLFWGRSAGLEDGSTAPAVTVYALRGKQSIALPPRGQPLLLVFWATWCPACREELPAVDRVARRFAEAGLQTVAITDEIGAEARVEQFLLEHQLTLTVALERGEARSPYGVSTLPTTYLIDASGKVAWSRVGAVSESRLVEAVERVLSGGTPRGRQPAAG